MDDVMQLLTLGEPFLKEFPLFWQRTTVMGLGPVEADYAAMIGLFDVLGQGCEVAAVHVVQGCEAVARLRDVAEQVGTGQVAAFFQHGYELLCRELV